MKFRIVKTYDGYQLYHAYQGVGENANWYYDECYTFLIFAKLKVLYLTYKDKKLDQYYQKRNSFKNEVILDTSVEK